MITRTATLALAICTPLLSFFPSLLAGRQVPSIAFAEGGTASITVEQRSPLEALGTLLLIKPDQESLSMDSKDQTVSSLVTGQYTLFVDSPQGTTVSIFQYIGSEIVKRVDKPQLSFMLGEGDAIRFVLQYKLSKVGSVGVDSRPVGVPFLLEGPNDYSIEGVTPTSYRNSPIGQYKVTYYPTGCYTPPPQGHLLEEGGRVHFTIEIVCDDLDIPQQAIDDQKKRFVTTVIDGEMVVFTDVLQESWFASSVFIVAKLGILAGYKDDHGRPTGIFGPGNHVTLAELAKIAHVLAGIDEKLVTAEPTNQNALGKWFERFIASAEDRAWVIYEDPSVDLTGPATRGEVMITILQALNISLDWQTGTLFSDVTRHTPYAAAIETAANDKIVGGRAEENGQSTGLFGPLDPVNRAEMAKIISAAITVYKAGEEMPTKKK